MKSARFWHRDNEGVVCDLCPHGCKLANGEFGLCGARRALDGALFSLSYGCVSAAHLDPIEKKPLRQFMPGSMTFSIGSYGCNLFCTHCQNSHISRARPSGEENTAAQAIIERAQALGALSLSYTYNEPITFIEFALETAALARKAGLKNILVTNAYAMKGPFEELLSSMDAMNIDIKAYSNEKFRRVCGGELCHVLENVRRAGGRCHVEITALMVSGLCDVSDVLAIAKFIAGVDDKIPLHITRHFPHHRGSKTPIEEMYKAKFGAQGLLEHVYLGNIL